MQEPSGSSDEVEPEARQVDATTRGPMERAADDAVRVLRRAPPLALMAVGAAMLELVIGRLGWFGLTGVLSDHALRQLHGWPTWLVRNLAAVSGIVALTFSLLAFLRLPGYAPVGRRLAVAAFSGIFVPSLVVATVLPYAALRRKLVIFGLAAANVLVTLLGMTAVRYQPGRGLRIAIAGATMSCFLTLVVVGLGQLVHAPVEGIWAPITGLFSDHPTTTQTALLWLRHLGELGWIATLVGAAWTAVWGDGGRGARRRLTIGLGLGAAFVAAILLSQEVLGHRHFRIVLFGAFRLGLFLDHAPAVYALPLAIALAGGLVGVTRRDAAARELGAGLLAWLAAGFGPHTPIQLLYLVLGATLLTRAAQALDPHGAWRTRQPWARLSGQTSASREPDPGPESDPRVERETYDDIEAEAGHDEDDGDVEPPDFDEDEDEDES